jgi:hypothetical protein
VENGKLDAKSKDKVMVSIKSSAALKANNKRTNTEKIKSVEAKKNSLQNNLPQQIRKVSA